MDLSHPPLHDAPASRLEDIADRNQSFYGRRPAGAEYPVQTIGIAAGSSILKQTPGLAQYPPNNFPSGTLQSAEPGEDPMHAQYSPHSEGSGIDNETQAYLDRAQSPEDQSMHNHLPPLTSFGLSDLPPEHSSEQQFRRELQALEEERRARAYADMSAAEQYALQARLHSQKKAEQGSNQASSVYGGLVPAPAQAQQPIEPVVSLHDIKRKAQSDGEESNSLGSPFRHRSNSANHRPLPLPASGPKSPSSQHATSRAHSTATARVRPPLHTASLRGSARKISSSSLHDSGHGLGKDELLERMAEALRKERAKNKSYAKELIEAENEIDALSSLLDNTRSESAHLSSKHLAQIASLRRELDRARMAVEQALEVKADDAERFLDLLDTDSLPSKEKHQRGLVAGASDEEADGHRPRRPITKTEAILNFAADEPGGVNAKARQRTNERIRRLDNALSTIASSSMTEAEIEARTALPWPQQDNTKLARHEPITITMEPSSTGTFSSLFRKRSTSASRADVPDLSTSAPFSTSRLPNRLRSHRRASDTDVSRFSTFNSKAKTMENYMLGQSAASSQAGLLPPAVAAAHAGGTYGRSPSSDINRNEVMEDAPKRGAKRREKKTSISKILSKGVPFTAAFPVRDQPKTFV